MIRRNLGVLIIIFMALVFVYFFVIACGGTAKPAAQAPAGGSTSAAQVPEPGYTPGQTVDAEDYAGPAQQVANWEFEPAVTTTTPAKKECVRYKTVTGGQRRCAEYKTTPAKTTVTDDADWYLVLADGTRVDVDEATQAAHPVGSMYP